MARTLILTRHAKSSWSDPSLDDFDRPLNARGRKSADAIGAWLRGAGQSPDEVLVSGARRTVETWSRMAHHFPPTATMTSNPALYLASAPMILGTIRTQSVPTLMVICHNPGIADFATQIVTATPTHPRYQDFPTCATSIIEFNTTNWADIDWSTGRVTDFAIPRELTS